MQIACPFLPDSETECFFERNDLLLIEKLLCFAIVVCLGNRGSRPAMRV